MNEKFFIFVYALPIHDQFLKSNFFLPFELISVPSCDYTQKKE